LSSKLFNRSIIKVSREHYGQLLLLVDYLTLKVGGKVDIPAPQEMKRMLAGYDSALIPDPTTDGAMLVLRKAENGPAS
jgi:hypothetical protein